MNEGRRDRRYWDRDGNRRVVKRRTEQKMNERKRRVLGRRRRGRE
jgi:hypothetical protein